MELIFVLIYSVVAIILFKVINVLDWGSIHFVFDPVLLVIEYNILTKLSTPTAFSKILKDCYGNPDTKRLYDDLLRRRGYNKLVRPVKRYSDVLRVKLGLKLSQLIDVDEKNQVMTTNVWLTQEWIDENLRWTPSEYGGVDILYVPSEEIWLPDVVLFNNADGNYEVTLMTKAILRYDGRVLWEPPAVYKSSCTMNVQFFPFDEQLCSLKFASWTYDSTQVEIIHIHQKDFPDMKQPKRSSTLNDTVKKINFESNSIEMVRGGIDLTDYYENVEWDLLAVPALKKIRPSSSECPFLDRDRKNCTWPSMPSNLLDGKHFRPEITFDITIRRKTLFHTVNLILPCVAISLLTVIVFHLPSDSGEKIALSISILLSLTVFFLLLAEIIPPTSLVVPLIGKFLLFTMLLVTVSVIVTVLVLDVHFRIPSLGAIEMGARTRYIFFRLLPRVLRVDVIGYFKNKKSFLSYGRSGCLGRAVPREFIPSFHSGGSFQLRGLSPLSILCKTEGAIAKEGGTDLFHREAFVFGGGSCSFDAQMASHPNNFTRNTYSFGKISDGKYLRSILDDVTGRFMEERSEEAEMCVHPLLLQVERSEILKAFEEVQAIAEHLRREKQINTILEDWKFVAATLDRLFFWLFTLACVSGGVVILLQAPSIYDSRAPLTQPYLKQ